MTAGTLTGCFESVSIAYRRVQNAVQGGGAVHVRQLNTSHTPHTNEAEFRVWTISTRLARPAQFDAVDALWVASIGGALPITWTPPDEGSPIDVRIVSYSPSVIAPGLFGIDLVLEEDF